MRDGTVRVTLCTLVASLSLTACCMPYAVGSTARPVLKHQTSTTGSFYAAPDGAGLSNKYFLSARRNIDLEARTGVSDRADIGIRVPSLAGVIVNYKYRLNGRSIDDGPATSIMVGGGLINLFDHAEFEATLLQSVNDGGKVTPYGGLRFIQVAPIAEGAEHRLPALGGFAGIRIGSEAFAASPEIGAFYDVAGTGDRSRRLVLVPTISLHGDLLALFVKIGDIFGPAAR